MVFLLSTEAHKRQEYVSTMSTQVGTPHLLCHAHIYNDMIKLFDSHNVILQHPFRVHFEGEMGIDTGGLTRDAFSAFWEKAYFKHFDGSPLLRPVIYAGLNDVTLQTLGRILSFGYLTCGFLPARIAFPTLAAILLRSTPDFPADILFNTFKTSLTPVDLSTINEALQCKSTYPQKLSAKLINLFSRYDCLEVPTSKNILALCQQSARYQFIHKPFSAITNMGKGVPTAHYQFWDEKGVLGLYQVYLALTVTPEKVLECIEEPLFLDNSEQRVFNYLTQYIGRMKVEEVQRFLWFWTGSSVCVNTPLKVIFNGHPGLERRPIAHTCDCKLELSRTYTTFLDFAMEFTTILSQEDNGWNMDGI